MYRPPLARKAAYLYEVWYDTIDYAYAYQRAEALYNHTFMI